MKLDSARSTNPPTINVFIYDPIAPDPEGIINQGHGNSAARAIQVYQGERIKKRALLNLFKAVVANNKSRWLAPVAAKSVTVESRVGLRI